MDNIEGNNYNQINSVEEEENGNNSSLINTFFNGLNAISGVGLISVPYALASGGWLSLILLFAIAVAAYYAGVLTERCMRADPSIKTYHDIGYFAYGKTGKWVASIILYIDLYLVLTGYLILEGDHLHNLFPRVKFGGIGRLKLDGKQVFVMIIALVVLPSTWLDDLRILSYISATGVIANYVILLSIIWVGCFDGVGFHHKGELQNWRGIPMAASLFMFSYSANPVFPTLYNSMQKKQHFSKVLLLSFACATFCYTTMAILGYMMFGSEVNAQITLNLPTHKLSSRIAIYTSWIIPLSKYALMLKPVATATECWFPYYSKKRIFRILLRTSLVVTQVIIALTFPFFGYLMTLVGALLSATASITVPCLCYLKISNIDLGVRKVYIIMIIVLSLLIVVFGTYISFVHIIKEVDKKY